jgi:23S rRNA (uracil1939-C5)-methyltransferase
LKAKIEKVVFGGKGIAKVNNKTCFIPFSLPEEVVEVEIISDKKDICEGYPVKILKESPFRIAAKCKYYLNCGGCDFQHVDYSTQLHLKKEILEETLERIGKINKNVDKVIPSSNPFNYRNRVQFKFDGKNFGFYKTKTNEVVEIDRCEIADENINKLIQPLKNFALKNKFINEMHVFYPEESKPTLKIYLKNQENLTVDEIEKFFNAVGIYVENKRIKIYGKPFTFYKVNNFNYRVSLDSFFQVNKYQIYNLIDEVLNEIPDNTDCIGDIYCGVGLLSIPVSKKVAKVFGIELSKSAVKDANYNAKINNVQNVKFYQKNVLKSLDIIYGYEPQILIFDPPRTGIPKNVIENLIKLKSLNRIIYVSCNPSTAARDINMLSENFKLTKVKLIDMFPQTHHIESIFVLDKI